MASTYTFTIEGEPIPKGRPRFTRSGRAYTPEATRRHERVVRSAATRVFHSPLTGLVKVRVEFSRGTRRPVDLDNLLKAVLDGINGVAFADDRQVVAIEATKRTGCRHPLTVIEISKA